MKTFDYSSHEAYIDKENELKELQKNHQFVKMKRKDIEQLGIRKLNSAKKKFKDN